MRIDEQPFPVQRHHLNLQRFLVERDALAGGDLVERPVGIEQMRAHPGHRAQNDDDHQRDGPDDEFELGRVIPVGVIARRLVGCAIAPREIQRHEDHRQDDDQHQPGRDQQHVALARRDVAARKQQRGVAGTQDERQREDEEKTKRTQWSGPVLV
ncbi:hypothetical protein [Jiella pelagia]|uniref:Uncharacterized protein n=1 Tax=Jiella pelagia TaxID=2986949 RepID=A0ABY7BVY1_9HYPH|nr:hypothetical protein [Jiella pelagia]WAP67987.1 hypothetical protein OH818_21595 [Jiella pelagia]